MTNAEFEREFDILYNSIMSNAAPSIDIYEKSVLLTKAQEELVTSIYNGTFEGNENLTESIDVLVITENINSSSDLVAGGKFNANLVLSRNSKVFELSNFPMFIIYEVLKLEKENNCGEQIQIPVKPSKHDEYNRIRNNPFRKPRKNEALRINVEDKIEIISTYSNYFYFVRYLRRPNPIILYDKTVDTFYTGLTINGSDVFSSCELDPLLHRLILDRAVQLAAETYKITN